MFREACKRGKGSRNRKSRSVRRKGEVEVVPEK